MVIRIECKNIYHIISIFSSNSSMGFGNSSHNEPPTHELVELPFNVSTNPPPLPPKPGLTTATISVRPPSPPPPLPPRRDQAPLGK